MEFIVHLRSLHRVLSDYRYSSLSLGTPTKISPLSNLLLKMSGFLAQPRRRESKLGKGCKQGLRCGSTVRT
eukprot:16062-Amphidinium_carterae.1